jgi:hypothetical protein
LLFFGVVAVGLVLTEVLGLFSTVANSARVIPLTFNSQELQGLKGVKPILTKHSRPFSEDEL